MLQRELDVISLEMLWILSTVVCLNHSDAIELKAEFCQVKGGKADDSGHIHHLIWPPVTTPINLAAILTLSNNEDSA